MRSLAVLLVLVGVAHARAPVDGALFLCPPACDLERVVRDHVPDAGDASTFELVGCAPAHFPSAGWAVVAWLGGPATPWRLVRAAVDARTTAFVASRVDEFASDALRPELDAVTAADLDGDGSDELVELAAGPVRRVEVWRVTARRLAPVLSTEICDAAVRLDRAARHVVVIAPRHPRAPCRPGERTYHWVAGRMVLDYVRAVEAKR